MPYVMICENNQNAPLTSQSGRVPAEKENAVICNIQQRSQKDAGVLQVMTVYSNAAHVR